MNERHCQVLEAPLKPQNLGDTNVETLRTESASDPGTGIADIEDITENNMRRCYELTSAEIYFMNFESIDSVSAKPEPKNEN